MQNESGIRTFRGLAEKRLRRRDSKRDLLVVWAPSNTTEMLARPKASDKGNKAKHYKIDGEICKTSGPANVKIVVSRTALKKSLPGVHSRGLGRPTRRCQLVHAGMLGGRSK